MFRISELMLIGRKFHKTKIIQMWIISGVLISSFYFPPSVCGVYHSNAWDAFWQMRVIS